MENDSLYTSKIAFRLTTVILIIITLFFLAIIIGLLLIRKPDIVQGKFNLYSSNMPYSLIAKSYGELCFLQSDKKNVEVNTDVAYIKTSGDYYQIMKLHNIINAKNEDWILTTLNSAVFTSLGDVSNAYQNLLQAIDDFNLLTMSSIPSMNIKQSNLLINGYNKSVENQQNHLHIEQEKMQSIYSQYKSDSSLLEKKAITQQVYLQSKKNYLTQKENISQIKHELELLKNKICDEKENFLIIKTQHQENVTKSKSLIRYRIGLLKNAIQDWRNRFVLTAPIGGELEYSAYIENGHIVSANTEVLKILPLDRKRYGIIYFPSANSNNITIGTKVKLYLDSYNRNQYGFLKASISSLSSSVYTDSEGITYLSGNLQIDFSKQDKFKGNFHFTHGMSGIGDVIIKDKSLFTKIFIFFNNNFQ